MYLLQSSDCIEKKVIWSKAYLKVLRLTKRVPVLSVVTKAFGPMACSSGVKLEQWNTLGTCIQFSTPSHVTVTELSL